MNSFFIYSVVGKESKNIYRSLSDSCDLKGITQNTTKRLIISEILLKVHETLKRLLLSVLHNLTTYTKISVSTSSLVSYHKEQVYMIVVSYDSYNVKAYHLFTFA